MKPLVRCTTPSPSPTTPPTPHNANDDLATENPSKCNGFGRAKDTFTASPSSSSSASLSSRRVAKSRVRTRIRPRVLWAPRGSGCGTAHDDLALPLGMSFAAILSQVMNKNKQGERKSVDHLSKMCTSAVKESVTNIYGDKYDYFMRNFEKSFRSTLQTLHLISHVSLPDQEESTSYTPSDSGDPVDVSNDCTEQSDIIMHPPIGPTTSTQMVLHGNLNSQLSSISQNGSFRTNEINHHIITTLERSVTEQVRSNNLKEFEMGLIMKKIELKRSQLELSSYSHMLERVKMRMGMAKALFKEEKLKNQMQDARFSELVKSFIDVLVTGLIIMSVCFGYGTYVFSYERITEVTESCSAISKGSNSWWVPKQVSSFNSGWLFFRCHVVALTRLGFGIIMFLALAWLIIQKSSVAGPNMPITFNVMLLGVFCGFTGKWCVDMLGGDGLFWLIFWEMLCLIHFLGNAFPSTIYRMLHGPVSVSQGIEVVKRSYWIRRYVLYAILLVVLPVSAGLLPFASMAKWMEHFGEMISLLNVGEEQEL
ncbi:hypothetical protein LUZ61_003993 [Rhynchospora tenuis]|uniref:Protein CPR-5 n=1 Tax=Rhynchospora tenuis TaxID=198213 RepID=A0AAD6ET47_9POAL|nr:hypothetical protein LUZ61_003993 [Rhynchospora tenuis]